MFHLIPKNIVNISFLYPFFIIGYFSKTISHVGWKTGVLSIFVFLSLICYVWQPDYTVWKTGGYILQNTKFMLFVVVLRLVLAMAGIYSVIFILGYAYDKSKNSTLIVLFSKIGQQTLAIYLMQHIIVEIGLPIVIHGLDISDTLKINDVVSGYLFTPIISFILLYLMYRLTVLMGLSKYTKWLFGFNVVLSRNYREK